MAKRASTVAKVTKAAYYAMIQFMRKHGCGMIIRIGGVEYGLRLCYKATGPQVIVEGESCDYQLSCEDARKYATVRKGWQSDSQVWLPVSPTVPQYDQASYREWEQAYAHELWRMDTPDMLAYA